MPRDSNGRRLPSTKIKVPPGTTTTLNWSIQVKLDDAAAGTVRERRWSPNRVEVDVALSKPATVLFNQNWNEHWKTTRGEIVK